MATHDVALKVPSELAVGSVDLEVPVKRNGRRYGVLTISNNGLQWNPSTSRPPVNVSWDDLQEVLSASQPAAGAPAAKTARSASKSAPAGRRRDTATTAEQAPAEAPAPEATPEAPAKRGTRKSAAKTAPAEAPAAKSAAAPATKSTGKAASKSATSKSAAAKKSAPSKSTPKPTASKPAAAPVDARAVRQWAAENGIAVAPRGPISTGIIEQYQAATS